MKTWLWTGHAWRQLSVVEAKHRREAGFTVVEAKEAPKGPPKAKAAGEMSKVETPAAQTPAAQTPVATTQQTPVAPATDPKATEKK